MKFILVFDADNTLWDTDSIFRLAQLSLLEKLAKYNLVTEPESRLDILRKLDRKLFNEMGRFEYNFKVLALALIYYCYHSFSVDNSVYQAIADIKEDKNSEFNAAINDAYNAFQEGLKKIPKLYPDTEDTLQSFSPLRSKKNVLVTILLSEGEPRRLKRILKDQKICSNLFDEIVVKKEKNREIFENAKRMGLKYFTNKREMENTLLIAVGDSLKRDIKFGNQAGFITVYKPSPFMGKEEPCELDEKPCYTIQTLKELPPLLKSLGLPVKLV